MMKGYIQYRWSINTDNVYRFAMLYGHGFSISTLASYKNEVSGFVLHENLHSLLNALLPYGYSFRDKNIKLIRVTTYMNNWENYNP